MKLCFMCDVHLPYNGNAVQYDAFKWACEDIKKKKPDILIVAGDFTASGDIAAADFFIKETGKLDVPAVIMVGNSDLRTPETCSYFQSLKSVQTAKIGDTLLFAVDDGEGRVDDNVIGALECVDKNTIVVMHHPIEDLTQPSKDKMLRWREKNPDNILFCAHRHISKRDGNTIYIQALDPDKAIGENPCITYYDTQTQKLEKAYFFCPVPTDIFDYIGISCFYPEEDIAYAAKHGLKNIELRDTAIGCDWRVLEEEVRKWRNICGENLSMHAPEILFSDGLCGNDGDWEKFIALAKRLDADRITVHVPKTSVINIRSDGAMDKIAEYLAKYISLLKEECVIGIENMHMTGKDKIDETRRFGYLPDEVKEFRAAVEKASGRKIGINFDTGHARNNIPFSQKYSLGAWYAEIGKYTVGYHIHQVLLENGRFENHMPVTDVYGKLISYASFFKCWENGKINKAPIICEIRGDGSQGEYKSTIEMFEKLRRRRVHDIHSHTYYSDCGRDDPDALVKMMIGNGISVLGISDHSYGIGDRKERYLKDIRKLAEKYKDRVKILCGIEIPSLPEIFDLQNPEEIKDYDYCLIEHITYPESIIGKNIFEFCEKIPVPCGIAHTDLFEYCDIFGFDYEEFFSKMSEKGIFWEMNVSYDSIHKYAEHKYVKDFVSDERKQEIIRKSGVRISVGFDSHRLEDYAGERVHKMYDFLTENGFNIVEFAL